jgi:hypothetical protein
MTEQQLILIEVESYWCQRMTQLTEENKPQDANSLFSEFVVDGEDPIQIFDLTSKWAFLQSV